MKTKYEIKIRKWLPSNVTCERVIPAKRGGKYNRAAEKNWKKRID